MNVSVGNQMIFLKILIMECVIDILLFQLRDIPSPDAIRDVGKEYRNDVDGTKFQLIFLLF